MKRALVVSLFGTLLLPSIAEAEGLVYIATTPKGAQIAVDGKLTTRKTPVQLLLTGGLHKITVMKAGHQLQHRRVRIQNGKVIRVRLTLVPAPQNVTKAPKTTRRRRRGKLVTGNLTLIADVIGAKISLDGKPTGLKTPITVRVPVGRHTIRLAYGRAYVDQTVTIHRGNNAQIKVNLRPHMWKNKTTKARSAPRTHASDPTYPARRARCLKGCHSKFFVKSCDGQLQGCKLRCPGQMSGKIVNPGAYYSCEGVCKNSRATCLERMVIACKQRCSTNP